MNKLIFLVLSIFCVVNVFSQSQRIKGVIKADSLVGYAINIVNYTQKIGTTNNDQGYFEIYASKGDSLVFSSVQYEVSSLIVTEKHMNKAFEVVLKPSVKRLDVVRISNVELSGDLQKDLDAIEIAPFVSNAALGLPFRDVKQPTQAERRLYTATSSSAGIVPLDLVINVISGRLKKLQKIKEIETLKTVVEQGEKAFYSSFYIHDLGIPAELVTDFMYFCADDHKFKTLLKPSRKLDLLEFFRDKAKDYKIYKELK